MSNLKYDGASQLQTLILGNRDDIEEMSTGSSTVLTAVLKLIDRYDLYGQVAYPKHHKQSEVPHIYRLAAKSKGVFINPALVEPFGLTLIEAAAYGLPTVATKNGGPVDIHKVLNNGLLVDPHDDKAIADALLKLVSDKNRWLECRKNGLKNIHRYSWPEHCRDYLSHVEHCRSRHPTTRLEISPTTEEPMSESLKDVDDLSLRFSVDVDVKTTGDLDAANRHQAVIDALASRRNHLDQAANGGPSYSPGHRQRLFVIAVDCYDAVGGLGDGLHLILQSLMNAGRVGPAGRTGYVLSTGSTLGEALEALRLCHVAAEDFDALICCSGSEVYYPWKDLVADADYGEHIEYKWPGENVRSVVPRLAMAEGAPEADVMREEEACSSRCYAYTVKPGAKARRIDDIRQRLRMRGFRCNPVYVRASSRLNVVPLFASRNQALRYLSIRWGIDLSHMVVFLGEKGDTDLEDLVPGLHKTVVLKGVTSSGSEPLLRSEESYKREDAVAVDGPNLLSVEAGVDGQSMSDILEKLGME